MVFGAIGPGPAIGFPFKEEHVYDNACWQVNKKTGLKIQNDTDYATAYKIAPAATPNKRRKASKLVNRHYHKRIIELVSFFVRFPRECWLASGEDSICNTSCLSGITMGDIESGCAL